MAKMQSMRYCGKDQRLVGKTALVRDDPDTEGGTSLPMLLAQFDDMELVVDGVQMGFNWHLFERKEFN